MFWHRISHTMFLLRYCHSCGTTAKIISVSDSLILSPSFRLSFSRSGRNFLPRNVHRYFINWHLNAPLHRMEISSFKFHRTNPLSLRKIDFPLFCFIRNRRNQKIFSRKDIRPTPLLASLIFWIHHRKRTHHRYSQFVSFCCYTYNIWTKIFPATYNNDKLSL